MYVYIYIYIYIQIYIHIGPAFVKPRFSPPRAQQNKLPVGSRFIKGGCSGQRV